MLPLDRIDVDRLLRLESELNDKSLASFVDEVRRSYDLTNLVYHCPSFPGRSLTDPYLLLTYSEGWVAHYKAQRYVAIDPVFNLGARSVTPLDWNRLPRVGAKVGRLFNEAAEAGVGRQGVTIPVRGPSNGTSALFSATADDSDEQWDDRRHELVRDLVYVAHFVHQHAAAMHGAVEPPPDLNALTRREIEALKWSAEGRTTEEVGAEMGVQTETAKAHLDSARFKLGALNRVHAVAKAIRAGLIA